ncbi:MAG TPA: ABC transporter ATP-binding protein, partial [Planctomycetota bacterium]|nr:ABC transporter ATP-binding protein [Planctomycetota bacterium]
AAPRPALSPAARPRLPCPPVEAPREPSLLSFGRLLWPHARPFLALLALVVALGSVSALTQNAPVLLIEPMWPVMFPDQQSLLGEGREPGWVTEQLDGLRDFTVSLVAGADATPDDVRLGAALAVVVALLVLGIVGGIASYAFVVLSRWVAFRMVVDLRQRLAKHLMGLSVRYHGDRQLGDLLSRISADVGTTLAAIDIALKELIQEPARALVGLAIAVYAAPQLTLGLLIALPALALPVALLSKRVRKRSRKSYTLLGATVQTLTQMFLGVRTVKAFRAEERELARYRASNESFLHASMRMVRAIAATRGATDFLSSAGMAALILAAALLAINGAFGGAPDLTMFFIGVAQAYNHLRRTTHGVTRLQESMGASVRLQALLDERVDLAERADPVRIAGLGSGVRLEGVSFRYPSSEAEALRGVTLHVRPGEKLAIVGPSGAGKSTLMDLLARFVDPTAGRVAVDGHDLRDLSLDDWTGLYAMVGQQPFLFHTTVGENIRYGKPGATEAEVVRAARAAHIHDFVLSLPKGYDTDVADAGSRLSGGQRQRLCIARALLKEAPLLLLDEATSALDSESEKLVQDALDRLMQNRTVVVIAHRLSTIRNADRIAVLDQGRLVELGTHAELLERDGVYARLFALQQAGA